MFARRHRLAQLIDQSEGDERSMDRQPHSKTLVITWTLMSFYLSKKKRHIYTPKRKANQRNNYIIYTFKGPHSQFHNAVVCFQINLQPLFLDKEDPKNIIFM